MHLTITDVVEATGGRVSGGPPDGAVITGVSTDTRTLHPGDLFVALRGPRRDGHDFIPEAFARGAAAVLTSRGNDRLQGGGAAGTGPRIVVADTLRALGDLAAYYRRTRDVRVVGITGSVGKTTTAAMCAAVLAGTYQVVRTRDDWNAEIGVPLTVLGLRDRDEVAVIEMAMRGLGQIADLVRIARPQIGVVTNIGETHLALLGSLDNVARAKGELLSGLPPDGTAVLNADDARVLGLRDRGPEAVITFGMTPAADVRADGIAITGEGTRFRLIRSDGTAELTLRAWGTHTVANALAAAAVAQVLDVDVDGVRRALARWSPPKMRLQVLPLGEILLINDAYNASPASMAAAFEVVHHLGEGRRRVLVLGEMRELGPASAARHRAVGKQAGALGALFIVVGGPDADELAAGVREADGGAVIHRAPDAAGAASRLRAIVRAGDVVLVKGSRALAMEAVVESLRASLDASRTARP